METIENQVFDAERALYASRGISLINCAFDGPADGESALKESADICLSHCFCNLRYPFWHDRGLMIEDSEMTPLCRAALWYSDQIEIVRTKLYGIKALRECSRVTMRDCDIRSPEFGWSVRGIEMERCNAESEYFMMRAQNLIFTDVCLKGKYSFQYIQDARLDRCTLDTKDALWHAKHVTVQNSVIRGEYLAWYCEDVTFKNCKISGTQPFCYCKGLKLIDCELTEADLCFEKIRRGSDPDGAGNQHQKPALRLYLRALCRRNYPRRPGCMRGNRDGCKIVLPYETPGAGLPQRNAVIFRFACRWKIDESAGRAVRRLRLSKNSVFRQKRPRSLASSRRLRVTRAATRCKKRRLCRLFYEIFIVFCLCEYLLTGLSAGHTIRRFH